MKKKIKSRKLVEMSDADLLSLAAAKLKDRELFPQKVENAKKYLQKVDLSGLI